MLIYVFVLVAFLMGASGQFYSNKTCETIQNGLAAENAFNLTKFEGRWNEVERVKNPVQGECASANVTRKDTVLEVSYSDQTFHNVTFTVTRAPAEETGKLTVLIESETYPIWVLHTDYINFALVYSCHTNGTAGSMVYMSKLSRNTTLSAEHAAQISDKLSATSLRDITFHNITHSPEYCSGGCNLRSYTLSLAAAVLTSILVIS